MGQHQPVRERRWAAAGAVVGARLAVEQALPRAMEVLIELPLGVGQGWIPCRKWP